MWANEIRSLGGCYSCWWIHHPIYTAFWNCWATHTVADLYRKSGSDGQGWTLLLQVYQAPDPTEGEALTWIIDRQVNKYCLQPRIFSFSLSSGSSLLSTDTYFRLRFSVSILETINRIRSLQKHGPHLQQYFQSILPVAPCSRSNPEGVVLFFLSLTSGCNLVLLNSKDPTVLLASVQRISPFIIESLMNDLVRQ